MDEDLGYLNTNSSGRLSRLDRPESIYKAAADEILYKMNKNFDKAWQKTPLLEFKSYVLVGKNPEKIYLNIARPGPIRRFFYWLLLNWRWKNVD